MNTQDMDKEIKMRQQSCCGSSSASNESTEEYPEEIKLRKQIRNQYSAISEGSTSEKNETSTNKKEESKDYTEYTSEQLQSIPKESQLGLGSGNPVALANIQPGETVVDLGSGAGIDCFLASQLTGSSGKVIGVDMTPNMIDKARFNAIKNGFQNVEFRLGEIEHLPLADSSADVIISNCVINLALSKKKVFNEAFRVLRPGGRLIVSDIVLSKDTPPKVLNILRGTGGCVGGSLIVDDYIKTINQSGFKNVEVLEKKFIKPSRQPEYQSDGEVKRKLIANGQEHEVVLTKEEDEALNQAIMKGHIRALKP